VIKGRVMKHERDVELNVKLFFKKSYEGQGNEQGEKFIELKRRSRRRSGK